ncbi:hypothetical protein LO80_06300 [Candidatus Francisella endociliophora]|uniref:Uncharacterized protein n=1 Tax=Candidatus Francisella endociliophora TaxID=653937 RepID=A0A097EPZ4_9GAMM|nr:type VI secretion system baseplate subunit TssF/IglH [Francisella sp. FSC1006]AIT09611.1 hypothetical protein LO80_06300 [Francisella sp. FSC1006]
MNSEDTNDLNLSEISILTDTFKSIGDSIRIELDQRIKDYSSSLLYKYYNNLFYFLPKSYLIEIKDNNHVGYQITPDQQFFIEDKKNNNSLVFTPRLETTIAPVKDIQTKQVNESTVSLTLDFEHSFEYDYFTVWINPQFSKFHKYEADFILNELLNNKPSDIFAKVMFKGGNLAIKKIQLSSLKYQLKPIEQTIAKIHASPITFGFNVKIENLFSYRSDEVEQIELILKLDMQAYHEEYIGSLFKINLLPIFNSYDDYSYSVYTNNLLSQIKLRHDQDKHAIPISVLSIYENNRKVEFNNFFFKGQNEYYLNLSTQSLDYNVVLPNLGSKVIDTKIHTYTCWTQNIDVSEFIEISSSVVSSFKCKLTPISFYNEKQNFKQSSTDIFDLIDKLVSNSIFSKATFESILKVLQADSNDIQLLLELISDIEVDILTNKLVIITSQKYSKKHYFFIEFMVKVICRFINKNSFNFIKELVINEPER